MPRSFEVNGEVYSVPSSDSDDDLPLDRDIDENTKAKLNTYDPVAIVHVTILSRLVETFRFTSGPGILEQHVSCESLSQALIDHQRIVKSLKVEKQNPFITALQHGKNGFGAFFRCITGAYVPPLCSDEEDTETLIMQKTQAIWSHISEVYGTNMESITYQDLFDFEFPLFPETSAAERRRLMELVNDRSFLPPRLRGSIQVVTKHEVAWALDCVGSEASNQTMQFIFASGAEVLPVQVYRDIVVSLDRSPITSEYASTFFQLMGTSGKRMQGFLGSIVLSIMILTSGSNFVQSSSQAAAENMRHWLDDEWGMGCQNGGGVTSSEGCDFLVQTFTAMARPQQDAVRWFQGEFISKLWQGEDANETAAGGVGGLVLVGGLHVAAVFEKFNLDRDCLVTLNPSVEHYTISTTYDCVVSEWNIPFNYTKEQADITWQLNLPAPSTSDADVAVIADFAAVQPSSGTIVFSEVILSFPAGGGVLPHLHVMYIDPSLQSKLIPLVICKILITFWSVLAAFYYGAHGIPWVTVDFFLELGTAGLLISAYVYLGVVPAGDLHQIDSAVVNLRRDAYHFDLGFTLLGLWVLLQFFLLAFFLREKRSSRGVHIVFDLLAQAWKAIFGLGLLFSVWTIGFIMISMILFGDTTIGYSSFRLAFRSLIQYFYGFTDLDSVIENSPQSGPVFFVIYQAFVVFFVLNLLIAVMTAPLDDVRHSCPSMDDTIRGLKAVKRSRRWWVELKQQLIWPLCNILYDSTPLTQNYWLKIHNGMRTLRRAQASTASGVDISGTVRTLTVVEDLVTRMTPLSSAHSNKKRFARNFIAPTAADVIRDIKLRRAAEQNDEDAKEELANSYAKQGLNVSEPGSPGLSQDAAVAAAAAYRSMTLRKAGIKRFLWVRNSLFKQCVLDDTFDHISLALMIVAIKTECSYDIIREARMTKTLLHFDEFAQRLQRIVQLQGELVDSAYNKSKRLKVLIENDLAKRGIISHDERNDEQAEDIIKSATLLSTDLAAESFLDDNDQQTDTRNAGLEFETAVERAAHGDDTTKKRFLFGFKRSSLFHFDELIRSTMTASWQFLLVAFWGLLFFALWTVAFTDHNEPTAFLTRALNLGLRDAPARTRCVDENCSESMTMNFTFNDVADLNELDQFLFDVFRPAIWPDRFMALTPNDSSSSAALLRLRNATSFDPRITFNGPFLVRQIRAVPKPCNVKFTPPETSELSPFYQERVRDLDTKPCYEEPLVAHDTSPIPHPPTGIPEGISPRAYEYSEDCLEAVTNAYYGTYATYECVGYTAELHSEEQFVDLFNRTRSAWIGDATRLLVITGNFWYGNHSAVKYRMFAEMGPNFVGGTTDTIAQMEESRSVLRSIQAKELIIFEAFLAVHLIISVLYFIIYYIRLYCCIRDAKDRPLNTKNTKPSIHFIPLILAVITWVVLPIWDYVDEFDSVDTDLQIRLEALCATLYAMSLITNYVIYPIGLVWDKKFRILTSTMTSAMYRLLYLLPPFAIVMVAFIEAVFITFGRSINVLGRARGAAMHVFLMTFDGIDTEAMMNQNPRATEVFTALFFIVVTVIFANLILAMVTSASDDSRHTRPQDELCHRVLELYGRTSICGPVLEIMLSCAANFRCFISLFARRPDHAILIGRGRCLFPSEIMLSDFRPLRSRRLLHYFNYHTIIQPVHTSLIPWIIRKQQKFRKYALIRSKEDRSLQAKEEVAYVSTIGEAHAVILRQLRKNSVQRRIPALLHLEGLKQHRKSLETAALGTFFRQLGEHHNKNDVSAAPIPLPPPALSAQWQETLNFSLTSLLNGPKSPTVVMKHHPQPQPPHSVLYQPQMPPTYQHQQQQQQQQRHDAVVAWDLEQERSRPEIGLPSIAGTTSNTTNSTGIDKTSVPYSNNSGGSRNSSNNPPLPPPALGGLALDEFCNNNNNNSHNLQQYHQHQYIMTPTPLGVIPPHPHQNQRMHHHFSGSGSPVSHQPVAGGGGGGGQFPLGDLSPQDIADHVAHGRRIQAQLRQRQQSIANHDQIEL